MRGSRRRKERDEVGDWCREWARQRRFALGIDRTIRPWEQLGQMRCTLSKLKEGDGASYSAKMSQQFPEVYRGETLITHLSIAQLPGTQRMVIHLHYVWEGLAVYHKARSIPLAETQYWESLREAKKGILKFVRSYEEPEQKDYLYGGRLVMNT